VRRSWTWHGAIFNALGKKSKLGGSNSVSKFWSPPRISTQNLSHFQAMPSRWQISVSGDLLLWLRIAFGGGFSFDTKKKTDAYNLWATIHSLYGERRRTCFAEAGFVFDHGSTGLRCFFTFEILRRCRNARESISNLCASHRGHRQASPLPYFPFL